MIRIRRKQVYHIRVTSDEKKHGPCEFIIDPEAYSLTIRGEYGEYETCWCPTPEKESFLHFLGRLNEESFLRKLFEQCVFDLDASLQNLKEQLTDVAVFSSSMDETFAAEVALTKVEKAMKDGAAIESETDFVRFVNELGDFGLFAAGMVEKRYSQRARVITRLFMKLQSDFRRLAEEEQKEEQQCNVVEYSEKRKMSLVEAYAEMDDQGFLKVPLRIPLKEMLKRTMDDFWEYIESEYFDFCAVLSEGSYSVIGHGERDNSVLLSVVCRLEVTESPLLEWETAPQEIVQEEGPGIHKPDGRHTWGVEYNIGPNALNMDATDFVREMWNWIQTTGEKGDVWFHQCGFDTEHSGHYSGYQFFECFSSDGEKKAEAALRHLKNVLDNHTSEEGRSEE